MARPKAQDPLKPWPVRLGQRHKDIIGRIMRAKGIKDPSKAHRWALEFTDSILNGMGGQGPAATPSPAPAAPTTMSAPPPRPVKVADSARRVPNPQGIEAKVTCPACGNSVNESWLYRPHRVFGKQCPGATRP